MCVEGYMHPKGLCDDYIMGFLKSRFRSIIVLLLKLDI